MTQLLESPYTDSAVMNLEKLKTLEPEKSERGPYAKLALAILLDCAENIATPRQCYKEINHDCKKFVKDEQAVDFWFSVMRSKI